VRDTLVAVVVDPGDASDRLGSLRATELALVLEHARAQKLGTAAASCLRFASLPVPAWLEAHRFDIATRRATIMSTLAKIAPALSKSGIPWVVLKGPVTAASFESPHLREFGDLDILVPGRSLADVLDVFAGIGVDDQNHNWGPYTRYGVAEFPVFIGGAPIDLHWHLIGLAKTRKRFNIAIDELLSRRQPVSLGGIDCYRLDTEDHLMHVALHAGLSGAGNLGLLRDVHETARSSDIDWEEFMTRSSAEGVGPLAGQVLDRCVTALGTPIPFAVSERMAPSSARALRRWLDGRVLPWTSASDNAFSGFLVSSSRSGISESAARAGEILGERASGLLGNQPRWSAYDPDGRLYWNRSADDPDSFQKYLEYAMSESRA
jgi:hypothetical protein